MFVVFGVAYSFGAFFEPMAAEFGSGAAATSAVFSVTGFVWFSLGTLSGPAVDRYGPRVVLLVGAVAMGAGLVLTSRTPSLWLGYLTYGVGVGIGAACGYVPMLAVVSGWFDRRRAAALGVAVSGIGVGTVTAAPLAARLVADHGWRTTYLVFGLVSVAVLTVCAFVVAPPPGAEPESDADLTRLRAAAGTGRFRRLYASLLLLSNALFVPFVFLVPFATTSGVDAVAAAGLVGVLGGASVGGRLAVGVVADRLGHMAAFRACYLLVAGSYVLWLIGGSYVVLAAFAVVLGVGYGGFVALSAAVVAELFGERSLGTTIGFVYTAAGVGSLVGPPLAGVIIDTATYRVAIAVFMALGIGA